MVTFCLSHCILSNCMYVLCYVVFCTVFYVLWYTFNTQCDCFSSAVTQSKFMCNRGERYQIKWWHGNGCGHSKFQMPEIWIRKKKFNPLSYICRTPPSSEQYEHWYDDNMTWTWRYLKEKQLILNYSDIILFPDRNRHQSRYCLDSDVGVRSSDKILLDIMFNRPMLFVGCLPHTVQCLCSPPMLFFKLLPRITVWHLFNPPFMCVVRLVDCVFTKSKLC